ncbi:PTS galactitol transporter subunit IIB [Lacticaseibacillus chiayiensis]|uniref:PTS galactitol transporter subunit IIB n=1 Tax=Lacticaseibacillus chiayiensis TaxID=2100821 RepID=UPI0010100BD4|nr:PTS galactitol transporter subunit IIB [Lacticaseibacillus chiayiensis]RXT58459.1 PTS galactitol transporter subunit IIB [Lacticaseibacillus chiayiensis]
MKTILVCCGSGVATSPQVANKINDFLEDQGLDGLAHAEPHPVETAKSRIDSNPDIIAYVGIAPADDDLRETIEANHVIEVVGVPWLTGMGEDDANEKIKQAVLQATQHN